MGKASRGKKSPDRVRPQGLSVTVVEEIAPMDAELDRRLMDFKPGPLSTQVFHVEYDFIPDWYKAKWKAEAAEREHGTRQRVD